MIHPELFTPLSPHSDITHVTVRSVVERGIVVVSTKLYVGPSFCNVGGL